jgi:16S rRNA (guanine966-N2)-methyltransferase
VSGIRIIGGRFRGRRLETPADLSIRPTSDRTREALFNILDHAGLIGGAAFLDLFCGTGAVGLEAWSRGAGEVWLVDRDIKLAVRNAEALGQPDEVHVLRQDATRLMVAPARFDLVFLDPPYKSGLAAKALAALHGGWLADEARVVVEIGAAEIFDPPPGFGLERERRYGAAKLIFLRSER